MTRRKFTPKFKSKVVLEALKERQTTQELAQKFEISPHRSTYGNGNSYPSQKRSLILVPRARKPKLRKKKNVCLKL
jgi:transposase